MTGSKIDLEKTRFADLEQSFALGNKAALYETISRSLELGAPLPSWAASELQKLVLEKGVILDEPTVFFPIENLHRVIRDEVHSP